VVGDCATRREVVQVADLSSAAPSPLLDILLRTGVRAVLAVPLLHQAEVVGVLVVRRNQPGTFSPEVIRLVEAFAAQSAIAVENARLFWRDRPEEPRARDCQPTQVAVRRQHEP
jgi:GAF domain-containing protein